MNERCVSTWVVLTCGCKDGAEVGVNDALDEVEARASCERGSHGRCFNRDTMVKLMGPGDLVAAVVYRLSCARGTGVRTSPVQLVLRVTSMCLGW